MTDLFLPDAALGVPLVRYGKPCERAVEAMQIADKVLQDPTGLVALYKDGFHRIKVGHRTERDTRLEVMAQRAKNLHYGVSLLFCQLLVKDCDGEMSLYLERKRLREYDLNDDPFVDLILSRFATHLGN